jgi:hypothetical protein
MPSIYRQRPRKKKPAGPKSRRVLLRLSRSFSRAVRATRRPPSSPEFAPGEFE